MTRYTALDMSLLWRATPHLDLALTTRNLGDESHPEYSGGNEIERSVYASVTWRDWSILKRADRAPLTVASPQR